MSKLKIAALAGIAVVVSGCLGAGSSNGPGDAAPVDGGATLLPVDDYIWIANNGEGTVSKVCTITAEEVARYLTGPAGVDNDPSRTSVNLHGDVVVTNRDPIGALSSVTKFAADEADCVDRNENGVIDTSTGGADVKPWGEDECMLWSTELGTDAPLGARATAWDGEDDPSTGLGGRVWVATCFEDQGDNSVFALDGDTGDIEEEIPVSLGCGFSGAMDGNGAFWIWDSYGCEIVRVDMVKLTTESFPIECGYGLTVDTQGRVWTGGPCCAQEHCISRFDPSTTANEAVSEFGNGIHSLRGIAEGSGISAGYIWAADANGVLVKVDRETLEVNETYWLGTYEMVGVAIDKIGLVWTVSSSGKAYRFDPRSQGVVTVPLGESPYTFSDMTGVQLRSALVGD